MPIEIRELIIKATADSKNVGTSEAEGAGNAGSSEADIHEIVEKVLRIINEKSER